MGSSLSRSRKLGIVGFLTLTAVFAFGGVTAAITANEAGKGVVSVRTAVANYTAVGIYSPTTYQNIPDMTVSPTVPAGEHSMFLVTFSVSNVCFDDHGCYYRALMDGNELPPGSLIFNSDDNEYTANSFQWVVSDVGPGQHNFRIQVKATQTNIDARTLTVMRIKQ